MTSTPFENEVYDLYNKLYGSRLKPFAQRKLDETRQQIRNLIRKGQGDEADKIAYAAIDSGLMTEKQYENIVEGFETGEKPAERMYRMLPPDLKKSIYEKYKNRLTPEQLESLYPYEE